MCIGASLSWATKALLRRALLDEDVARFVTISDACVPVRTFPEVRAYLLDGGQDQVSLLRWHHCCHFADTN